MALVNIPRDRKDQFYRYKMPEIIAKVEGRGNGIKTVIVNLVDVAKALDRPAAYPLKFFGFELAALTVMEEDKSRYIINGKHDQSKLAEVLDNFIEKFVLCHSCERNPETKMIIKNGLIDLSCKACGGRTPVDMRHKLTTFILKNPPPKDRAEKKVADRKAEREKLTSVDKDKDKEKEGSGSASKEKRKSRKSKEDDDDDVVWHTDTSAEAVEARRRNLIGGETELAAKMLFGSKIGESSAEAATPQSKIAAFITSGEHSNEEILQELSKLKSEGEGALDDSEVAKSIFVSLFDKEVLSKLDSRKEVLEKIAAGNVNAQTGLLHGIVEICAVQNDLTKIVVNVVKKLYDDDILEEESILKWHKAASEDGAMPSGAVEKVKKAVQPLIKWLEEAEEESDEEEEEEDDDN
eukprot:TRINITY_DN2611_c0_g1_i1.p1 TRINITY_DN2611_c0_g1~~TRINITY_DN2611_c0_g1_i1.p1  ORF type:complete len:408 (-),score=97.02 TRINITY_DN2611_c0_g1_i1:170-1393(-)